MSRIRRSVVLALLLAAQVAAWQAVAQQVSDFARAVSAGDNMTADSNVATVGHPARISPQSGPKLLSNSKALRITLRPIQANPNSPFLAQIFAQNVGSKQNQAEQLLGVVSFYPLKPGQSQEFVLPAPKSGFPPVPLSDVRLMVKLIPANSARSIGTASVEVDSAQFVD
jgi:hypothetical protein